MFTFLMFYFSLNSCCTGFLPDLIWYKCSLFASVAFRTASDRFHFLRPDFRSSVGVISGSRVLVSWHVLPDICSNSARLFGKSLHIRLDMSVKSLPDVIHRLLQISSGDWEACDKLPPSPSFKGSIRRNQTRLERIRKDQNRWLSNNHPQSIL